MIPLDDDAKRVSDKNARGNERYDLLALMAWAVFRSQSVYGSKRAEPNAVEHTIEWISMYPQQVSGDGP